MTESCHSEMSKENALKALMISSIFICAISHSCYVELLPSKNKVGFSHDGLGKVTLTIKNKNVSLPYYSDVSPWLAYCFSLLIFARTKYEHRNKCIKSCSICLTILMLGFYLGHYGAMTSKESNSSFIARILALTFASFATISAFITLCLISMKTNTDIF